MKIKKASLTALYLAAKETDGLLTLAEARIRDSFLKEITPELRTFEEDRKVIYEKFCKLDEKTGKCDLSDGNYHFESSVLETLNKELVTLYEEESDITVPQNINVVISKTTYQPKIGETELIDSFLAAL